MDTVLADASGKTPAVIDNVAKQGDPPIAVMPDGSVCITIVDDLTNQP